MARIFNGTPHSINIIVGATYAPDIRKFTTDSAVVVATIPSTQMVSAKVETVETASIDGIPTFTKKVVGVDPLPEGYDIYVVSALYASAFVKSGMDASKLYTVADPVYSTDGRTILGSKGICPFI